MEANLECEQTADDVQRMLNRHRHHVHRGMVSSRRHRQELIADLRLAEQMSSWRHRHELITDLRLAEQMSQLNKLDTPPEPTVKELYEQQYLDQMMDDLIDFNPFEYDLLDAVCIHGPFGTTIHAA